jgi:hypothetical protein
MFDLCAVVMPHPHEPGVPEAWAALSTLAGLALVTALFSRFSGGILRELSLIADEAFAELPAHPANSQEAPLDPLKRTAVLFVTGYNAFGLQSLLVLWRSLPECFPQVVFLGVSPSSLNPARLRGYEAAARSMGMRAAFRIVPGSNLVSDAEKTCLRLAEAFSTVVFCSGKLELRPGRWYHRFLPDAPCEAIRMRLQRRRIPAMLLPVRAEIRKAATRAAAIPYAP